MLPNRALRVGFGILALFSLLLVATGCAAGETLPVQPGSPNLDGETVRMLIVGDPFSSALRELAAALGAEAGGTLRIEVVSYDDLRTLTLRNALDFQSAYDIVSFDVLWLGEYGAAEVLLPLDELIAATPQLEPDDFLQVAYEGSRYAGQQLGLPIQPHPELLWYRADRFAAAGLAAPTTTDELLAAAARLNDPERGQYGVCWNGQRGEPLGQQMANFYGAFGQPLLDAAGRPTLNTAQGIAAARYAQSLLAFSPPDVLNLAWDQRTRRFAQGGCAMVYEWTARIAMLDEEPTVRAVTAYSAPPHAPSAAPVTPLGSWSLGIPANIGARRELAWSFLEWLVRPENQRLLAENGSGGVPRYSLLYDPALIERYPAFRTIAAINEADQLDDWMRPAVAEWTQLAEILGTVYHDMLLGLITPEQAAAQAQAQAEQLFATTPMTPATVDYLLRD